jgi:hypothetical protein
MLHRVRCALPASICSQLPRLTLSSVLRYLFVCLFVWLVGWLVGCDGPLQNTPSMAQPTPHARRRAVMAYSRFAAGVRCACTGALPPTRRAAAAQAHCTSAYALSTPEGC